MENNNRGGDQGQANDPKYGWIPSNQEKYERFKTTLMHAEDWGHGLKYFAMYWLEFVTPDLRHSRLHSPMFENNEQNHAEGHLLAYLRAQWDIIDQRRVRGVIILQNASPCSSCSQNYLDMLGWIASTGIRVTLIFSSFFRVHRPSCVRARHPHLKSVQEFESNMNIRGLQELGAANVFLRTTEYNDWVTLRRFLQLPNTFHEEAYNRSYRKREDIALSQDLQELMLRR